MARLAGMAALGASLVVPAQATTFPSLTTIYVGVGIHDLVNGSHTFGTAVVCANQSGAAATVRWRFFDLVGSLKGEVTQTVPAGDTRTAATSHRPFFYGESQAPPFASDFSNGKVVVASTQSAVFCTAVIGRSDAEDIVSPLHMVRFHPHPGTVE
jgi:hypothetical protein